MARAAAAWTNRRPSVPWPATALGSACLLYTSDAADERSSVDLGGRRIIKKKNTHTDARDIAPITDNST